MMGVMRTLVVIMMMVMARADDDDETPGRRGRSYAPTRQYYEIDDDEFKPYAFEYEVDAPYHGTWHDRREKSSGHLTQGRFRVALPDHRLQTVTYKATHGEGFKADVHFEQHPDFPSLRGHIGKAPAIGQSVVPGVNIKHSSPGIKYSSPPIHKIAASRNPKLFASSSATLSRPSNLKYSTPVKHLASKSVSYSPSPIKHTVASPIKHSVFQTKHKIPKYEQNLAVGNEYQRHRPSKSFTSRGNSFFSITTPKPRPLNVKHHNIPVKPSFSSQSSVSAEPLAAFVSMNKHHNHFTVPGTSRPRANFVPARHTLRPLPTKPSRTRPFHSTNRPVKLDLGFKGQNTGFRPSRKRPGLGKVQSAAPENLLAASGVPIPHFPDKHEPAKNIIEPPATKDESFSIANKEQRYKIRREGMNSIRSRLKGIVHN